MKDWKKAQLQAIETKGKTMLVSAAAGSGKTTVLIERIIRSLTDPVSPADISRLLVVTFTRPAAEELRQRVSSALSDAIAERPNDKRLFRQLTSLGSAHISTIDAFYADIVRRNTQRLNTPPSLRIADNPELIILKESVMDRIINLAYSGELGFSGDDFAEMTELLYDMRNDTHLPDVFTDLYEKLTSHPRFLEFLTESASFYDGIANGEFFDSPIGAITKNNILMQLDYCEQIASVICDFFSTGDFADGRHLPPHAADLEFVKKAKEIASCEGYLKTGAYLKSYRAVQRVSIPEEDKTPEINYHIKLRDNLKDKLSALVSTYYGLSFTVEDMKRLATVTSKHIRILHSMLTSFDKLYREEKLTRGICEFVDIKLWTYKLLVNEDETPTDLARELADSFDAIYIDEYQDVDPIQDLIFRAISKPDSRFMVGDIKQSIYKFRGAEPSLFMNYRRQFPDINANPDADECTVFMSDNFRCDEPVVNFANLVCSHVFKMGAREITYESGDNLKFSKKTPEDYQPIPVKVALIDTKKRTAEEKLLSFSGAEVSYIAKEIISLTSGEKKANGDPIRYSDIAVLYRGNSFGASLAKELDRHGIPHTFGSSESIFNIPEVSLTVSLLNVINNPRRDIHLAGALMSPVFGFTAEDIVVIKESCPEKAMLSLYDAVCHCADLIGGSAPTVTAKCIDAVAEINRLRTLSESLPADKIIRRIYSEYSLISRSDKRAQNALAKLYECARSFEGDTFKGLYSFLNYINDMINCGKTISSDSEQSSDAVALMTMHKSKGLEFPVCFVSGCATMFNRDDTKDLLLYSQVLGLAVDIADPCGFGRIRTPFRTAISKEISDRSSEEEMRIMYVAFTRARERLYVTASLMHGVENELEKAATKKLMGTRASILDSYNYISWVLTALSGETGDFFDVETVYAASLCNEDDNEEITDEDCQLEEKLEKAADEDLTKEQKHIEDVFNYRYPYLHVSNIPAKLSVSKLSPGVLDRTEDTEEESLGDLPAEELPTLIKTPSFMADRDSVSAAQKGIDTHAFMQFCNFENVVSNGAKNELERLVRDGFLEKRALETVNLYNVKSFFESDLFNELSRARFIRREQRFNILLPASRFTSDAEYAKEIADETLLVQGVIDLVFESEDGRLILCDYKTDHLTEDELRNRTLAEEKLTAAHRRQLSYYAAAVKRIFGRAPDLVLIYSLPLGDTVVISPESID